MIDAANQIAQIRADALLRITQALETAQTIDELLMLSLNELTRLLDVPLGGIVLLGDTPGEHPQLAEFPPRIRPAQLDPHYMSVMQTIIDARQVLQFEDVAAHETLHQSPLLRERNVRTLLIVPLVTRDRILGLMGAGTTRDQPPRQFGEPEIAIARLLASQLAATLTAFRVSEAARRRNEELATLNDISATVTTSLNTREVYRLVVQKLNEYFKVDAGSLLIRDELNGDLQFVMTLEAGEEKLAGEIIPNGVGLVGECARSQHWLIVHDAATDPRHYTAISESVGYHVESVLCVPIVVKSRTIGVIELLNKREGQFTEEDAVRLSRMATTIGIAIENARLFQQVADTRDRVQAILNSTTDGIIMADMHGNVVIANPMAVRLLQIPPDELVGARLNDLLEALRARARAIAQPVWRSNGDDGVISSTDLEILRPQRRFVRQTMLPVRDTLGALIGHLAVLSDISQEKELEQLRDDYTGMLVHDLRAPLTAIMNGIVMVKRGLGGPVTDQQMELLNIAHSGSQSLLGMVNNLLDISRLEQGRMLLNYEPLSLYALVDEVLERLVVSATSQDVRLVHALPLGLPLLEADREKIARVIQNLMDNAIKFSPHGAEVEFGAVRYTPGEPPAVPLSPPELRPGNYVMFWVKDRGPGIPAIYHARIFEKFGQVQGRSKVRGSGLGLTFCKLAIEAHHGRIWLESVEGQGSTFACVLPVSTEEIEG